MIVKAYQASHRISQARQAGYPVFDYLAQQDMDEATIRSIAAVLDPARDYLVLPASNGDDLTYYPRALVLAAVATGVPVWVYPVHRQVDAAHYFQLGVAGAWVKPGFGYTSGASAIATADTWASKAIASGEMSRLPDAASIAPSWTGTDELSLGVPAVSSSSLLRTAIASSRRPTDLPHLVLGILDVLAGRLDLEPDPRVRPRRRYLRASAGPQRRLSRPHASGRAAPALPAFGENPGGQAPRRNRHPGSGTPTVMAVISNSDVSTGHDPWTRTDVRSQIASAHRPDSTVRGVECLHTSGAAPWISTPLAFRTFKVRTPRAPRSRAHASRRTP